MTDRPAEDPLAQLLRRAAAGDTEAQHQFHTERALRQRALAQFRASAHAHARAMIERTRRT